MNQLSCQRFKQNQAGQEETKTDQSLYQRMIPAYRRRTADTAVEPADENKIKEILGKARSSYVVSLVEKGDELTEDDLEIIQAVQEHVEEEQKQVVEETKVDHLICSLTKCYITGCQIHTLLPNCVHYGSRSGAGFGLINKMPERLKKGYEMYKKNPECSYIEVYERHICVVSSSGITKVIDE